MRSWRLPSFRANDVFLPLAFLLGPVLLRSAFLVEKSVRFSVGDLHGVVVDAFVSCLFAAIAALARRRLVTVALLLFWNVASYASYEFTKTMSSLPPWQSIRYLGDGTFLRGSVFVSSRPLLLVAVLVLPLALVLLRVRGSDERARRTTLVTAGLPTVALGAAAVLWPIDPELLAWRQSNVAFANAMDLVSGTSRAPLPPLRPEQRGVLDRAFRADLSGADIVPALPKRTNVLLVLIEGIAGTDLPTVAELHGHRGPGTMPELDAIGRRNLYFRSFLTHQRGTNRGLYASLCGDYPKLGTGTAKMTELASQPNALECLPQVLRREGYETVYLQAAPLAFMLKHTFMPKSGFSRTLGAEQFGEAHARSHWGVDDRTFFARTREVVKELRGKDKPFMMTLLTVGTHHPYPVPSSFASPEPEGSFDRAARYTDGAIAELVRGLDEDGALDDTIVLVSSDESHGLEKGDDVATQVSQYASFMIALLPTRQQRIIDETFVQSDTALSVLDILGLADETRPFIGRSMFRSYAAPRRVFVANQNSRAVGMIDTREQSLWSCDETFSACWHLRPEGRSFVAPERTVTSAPREEIALLRAGRDRAEGQSSSPFRELSLVSDTLVLPITHAGHHLVLAGQYLDLPPEAVTLDMDVELDVVGPSAAKEVVVTSDLVAEAGQKVLASPEPFRLRPGESAVLRYSCRTEGGRAALHGIEARTFVDSTAGDVTLRVIRATLRVRAPLAGERPGLVVRERSVRRVVD